MARKLLLLTLAILIPGGLVALVLAAFANWLKTRAATANDHASSPADAFTGNVGEPCVSSGASVL